MGTKMAPAYAGIFMASLEGPFLESCTHKPTVFKRYIDDIIVIWEHGQDALDHFLQTLNSIHPTINPFPALIKSKNLLNIDHFCFYFTSSRWSAVSVNHSKPPESVMNHLQDGGGFVA